MSANFDRARAAYLRELNRPMARLCRWLARMHDRMWRRFPGNMCLLYVLPVVVLLCIASAQAKAQGVEVPDRIVAAVAMVETGVKWRDTGDIKGGWSHGDAGEISHWQITPAVLDDLGLSSRQARKVATDPVYAESVFRLWYSRLLARTGSHAEALAAYHRGLGGRHRRDAREYARRVLNIAESL